MPAIDERYRQEEPMVDIVIRSEQIRSAPVEVKAWLAALLDAEPGAELGAPAEGPQAAAPQHREVTLAECSAEEAGQVLEQIRDDTVACQVFFELSRDGASDRQPAGPIRRLALADMLTHTRLADPDHLAACLDQIGRAFQSVRRDPSALLFALDRTGGLYVHETTRGSIRALWQLLVTSRLIDSTTLPGMAARPGASMPLTGRPAA
jgi:hypothetical protein